MLILLACAGGGDAEGRLVDARTDAPIADTTVLFTADGDDDCARRSTRTDAAGTLAPASLCAGRKYRVSVDDALWRIDPPVTVDGDAELTTLALTAWRAPTSDGIYLLEGTTLSALPTQTAVSEAMYAPAGRALRFPTELPDVLPVIEGDRALVLVGPDLVDRWRLEPTWDGPTLTLGVDGEQRELWPWVYIGARVREDGALEPMAAEPKGVVDVGTGDERMRYLRADSVPAGRYALTTPNGARALLVKFGANEASAK